MHGINVLISHTLYLAISLTVLSALLGTYIYITQSWEKNIKIEEMKEIGLSIKSQISDLHTYEFNSKAIEKRLDIKNYIGNKKYKIEFEDKTIKIYHDEDVVKINISEDFKLNGSAYPPAKIVYFFPENIIEIKGV